MDVYTIIENILEELEPIVKTWKQNHPANATSVPDSARTCLYHDVYNLGYVIFTADKLGQQMEIKTLAELLAKISKGPSSPDLEKMEQHLFEKITGQIKEETTISPTLPQSIMVAREFDDRNNTNTAQKIEELFDQLLDSFILRDGNVTTEELEAVKTYENLWKRSPY